MLDLNEKPKLPSFELTTLEGEVKSYDTLLISYSLRVLDTEKDPKKIQEIVNETFKVNVDAFTAMIILNEFAEFAEEHLEEPLKKVFGAELYSTFSTVSRPENSKS